MNHQASPEKRERRKEYREIMGLPAPLPKPFNSLNRGISVTSPLDPMDSQRVSGVPNRKPINRRSKKQAQREYQDAKLRKELWAESDGICAICCCNPAAEDSHNRAKSKDTLLRHVKLNHLLICHACHEEWRANPARAYQILIDRFPEAAALLNAEAWRDLALWKSQPVKSFPKEATQ